MRAYVRLACVLGVVGCLGCKSSKVNDGYAIDLTLVVDSTVSDADLARATLLDLEVTGAETYSDPTMAVAGKFDPKTRTAGLRYRPKATAGVIAIHVSLIADDGSQVAQGQLDNVSLGGGTQLVTMALSGSSASGSDGGVDGGSSCGNGIVDSGETCDPGAGSPTPCPQSSNDCDDKNSCTTDALTGTGCQAVCTHTPLADNTGCMTGTTSGVCLAGACCTGCIKNGVCLPGSSDAKACGAGGNSCFDCTQNSATATCNAGNCSGCDATSCTTEGRTCGTSSCGYNCGGCPDGCSNGTLTHYACVNKTCQMNGSGNCGLYSTCASSTTCATSCTGDNGCVATAWCGSNVCKLKAGLGGTCSAEVTGDHECSSPYVCSWGPSGTSGFCVMTRCTGCAAATSSGNCGGYIDYGADPRSYCPYKDSCHQNFCKGTYFGDIDPPECDYGVENGLWRPCGTFSCSNTANGTGTITGYLCSGNGCQPSQSQQCADPYRGCYACNSSVGCDFSKFNATCN